MGGWINLICSNLERELETVINVLQPGPLGTVEHKFSDSELDNAKATVARAVASWRKAASSSH